jgi:hypothetical protein
MRNMSMLGIIEVVVKEVQETWVEDSALDDEAVSC